MRTEAPAPSGLSTEADGSRHVPALDGLRGLAILLVIPHNVMDFDAASGWAAIPAALARAGWTGVELFFVLSGYLITSVLLGTRDDPHYFRNFYVRRALRIVPLYYLVLALFLFVVPRLVALPPTVLASYDHQLWFWLFLNNWAQATGHMISWFGPCWSLAVEEQFYLFWPLVVAACAPERLLRVALALIAYALLARGALLLAHVPPGGIYRMTICRLDALAAGAAVAVLARRPALLAAVRARSSRLLLAAAAVLLGGALLSQGYSLEVPATHTLGYTTLALALAAILLVVLAEPTGAAARLLALAPLRSAGRYS